MTLQRIEDAIERLEAATRQAPAEVAHIQASNVRLREAVTSSLGRIDALIARQGTEQPS